MGALTKGRCPMKYKYSIKQLQRMERCRWLTDRERRVFNLYFRRGWTMADIAAELYLSPAAVKTTIRAIRDKCSETDP